MSGQRDLRVTICRDIVSVLSLQWRCVVDSADIDHRFAFHPASTREKQDEHSSARAAMREAALRVLELVPEGREKALALTKLEEAMMWANAGIARASGGSAGRPVAP